VRGVDNRKAGRERRGGLCESGVWAAVLEEEYGRQSTIRSDYSSPAIIG
jgi:hypothetical protein